MSNIVNLQPRLFDVMVEFFEEEEFNAQQVGEETILVMNVRGSNAQWRCYAEAQEDFNRFRFFSVLEAHAAESKRQAMSEFLTRANYGLPIGTFEMDFSDGEIRFRTSCDLSDVRLTKSILRNMVYPNLMMVDTYFPGIMAVLYTNTSAEEAIRSVEDGDGASMPNVELLSPRDPSDDD